MGANVYYLPERNKIACKKFDTLDEARAFRESLPLEQRKWAYCISYFDQSPPYLPPCNDKDCPGYGWPLTDRGYGFPVCPTCPDKRKEEEILKGCGE